MKKFKRMMALVMCLTLVLAFAMTASAESQEEIVPYGPVKQCLYCLDGMVTHNVNRIYTTQDFDECVHMRYGTDQYDVYKIVITDTCNKCSYRQEKIEYERVLTYCDGYN